MSKKAIILLSGGLDSATALAIAKKDKYDCYALSVNYHQRHHYELTAAKNIAKYFSVKDFKEVEIDINNPVKKVLVIVPGSEIYYLDQPHIDGNSRHSAIIDYKKINSIAALLNKLDELELDFILFDDELIQSEIYNDLRKVIAQSSVVVERYDSEIIKNRLLGKSIVKHLTLVKRIHD